MAYPTALSMRLLRRQGWQVAVVEKWIPKLEVRSDLWRFGDLLAVHPKQKAFLIVQATSIGNISSRIKKSKTIAARELTGWLMAGGAFEVWGWHQSAKGWQVKRVAVTVDALGELAQDVTEKPAETPAIKMADK